MRAKDRTVIDSLMENFLKRRKKGESKNSFIESFNEHLEGSLFLVFFFFSGTLFVYDGLFLVFLHDLTFLVFFCLFLEKYFGIIQLFPRFLFSAFATENGISGRCYNKTCFILGNVFSVPFPPLFSNRGRIYDAVCYLFRSFSQ